MSKLGVGGFSSFFDGSPRQHGKMITLLFLTLANCSNFWQRNMLYSLASAIPRECSSACEKAVFVPLCKVCEGTCAVCQACRRDHNANFYSLRDASCMSDEEYGILASVSFTMVFAVSGALAGSVVDRFSEARWLHASAILAWSVASSVKVISSKFRVLLVTRIIVGIAQGFNAPCSYPIIVSHFPPHERATANGIYSAGTYLGSALSSFSLLIATDFGWRFATLLEVAFGIAVAAAVYLFVDHPSRDECCESEGRSSFVCGGGGDEDHDELSQRPSSFGQRSSSFSQGDGGDRPSIHADANSVKHVMTDITLVAALRRISTNFRLCLLYLTTSARMTINLTIWTYLPTYYERAFPHDVAYFSTLYAIGTLVCGTLSSTLGGALADFLVVHNFRGAHGYVPAMGTLLSLAPVAALLYSPTFEGTSVPLLLSILLSECWLGPGITLLASDVPNATMGVHVSLLLVANQLVACVGPWIVSLSDDGTADSVRILLLQVVALFSVTSAAGFALLGTLHGSACPPLSSDARDSATVEGKSHSSRCCGGPFWKGCCIWPFANAHPINSATGRSPSRRVNESHSLLAGNSIELNRNSN